ncbi:MAG TPA: hypothetical protein VNZ47_11315 [Candidatus Dormibacteraeota bacterium]|nr:hypothetical protein [Candidatus Dormibacteraeota bacterium]
MSTKKPEDKNRYFAKRNDLYNRYLLRGMRILRKAEGVLLEDYAKYQAEEDLESLDFTLSSLAVFQLMLGRNPKAEAYLREREDTFPDSLDAKLAIARYLEDYLRDYRSTLRKLREVRLPKNPARGDFDSYYNALNLKGVAFLHLRQPQKAEKVMAELAEYTEANLSNMLFFFDLHFVELMIERKLGLQDCRAYLTTLRRRKQVVHDQKKTISLLRRVNRMLDKK